MADLTQILLTAGSGGPNQKEAEATLQNAEQADYGQFAVALAEVLSKAGGDSTARQLAGLLLKNSLFAKDKASDAGKKQRWVSLAPERATVVKQRVLQTVTDQDQVARKTAAQVLAKLGVVETPGGTWPELVPFLLEQAGTGPPQAKQAAMMGLGYFCEEICNAELSESVPQEHKNHILSAVVTGMRDQFDEVKLEATKALYFDLPLAADNFTRQNERDHIIQVVCEACAETSSVVVRVAAFECLVQIATEYYDHLLGYMNTIGPLTWNTIRSTAGENVAIPALEFWSTVCDEEIFLKELAEDAVAEGRQPERPSLRLISQALQYLVPLLTETLTRKDQEANDDDEEDWNLAMASGTCLSLVAQVVGDECVDGVLAFVGQNFGHADWRNKEAALLAYGSIMEGPSSERLAPLVAQSFSGLVTCFQDPSVSVRDTTAWTLGRIAQFHPSILAPHLQDLMAAVSTTINDQPRVAVNVCWIIDVMAENQAEAGVTLSPYFTHLVTLLLTCGARPDADTRNLRASAYNALSSLISKSGDDCVCHMEVVLGEICNRVEQTFGMSPSREVLEVQGALTGALTVLIMRLGSKVVAHGERLMKIFMTTFQFYTQAQGQPCVHEEALLAVGQLAMAVEAQFAGCMPTFLPVLVLAIERHEESTVCGIGVATVGDVARALGKQLSQYVNQILEVLYKLVNDPAVDRKLKPGIMQSFGDIALAVEGDFERCLAPVVQVLAQASQAQYDPAQGGEWADYISELHEAVLDAYTGIIHGLRESNKLACFKVHVNAVLDFVARVSTSQQPPSPAVTKSAVGVMGDLVLVFQSELVGYIAQTAFLPPLMQRARALNDAKVAQQCTWLEGLINRYRPPG